MAHHSNHLYDRDILVALLRYTLCVGRLGVLRAAVGRGAQLEYRYGEVYAVHMVALPSAMVVLAERILLLQKV